MGARERVASAALSFLFCISFAKLNAILVSLFFLFVLEKKCGRMYDAAKTKLKYGRLLEKKRTTPLSAALNVFTTE